MALRRNIFRRRMLTKGRGGVRAARTRDSASVVAQAILRARAALERQCAMEMAAAQRRAQQAYALEIARARARCEALRAAAGTVQPSAVNGFGTYVGE
jgi:hypothetical protein